MPTEKLKLKISDMHCASCCMLIDMGVEDLEGVKSCTASFANQICEVEYDGEKVNKEKIIETIKKTGYQATVSE